MNLTFDEVAHTYTDNMGNIVPSVTQIIGKVYGTGLESAPSEFVKRAAEKGTAIHKEIDNYLKTGVNGATPEFRAWKKWYVPGGVILGEKMIFGQTPYGNFAGTLDLYKGGWLYDWKTCKTATRQQISKWQKQLSFYAYAMRQFEYPVNEPMKIIHLVDETYEVIPVDYLGDEFVETTMALYKDGTQPEEQTTELQTVSKNDLQVLGMVLTQIKELEKVADEYREQIRKEMEQRGILNLTIDNVKISYISGTKRKAFDSASFKKDHNDLYLQYQKETTVKPTVRITVD